MSLCDSKFLGGIFEFICLLYQGAGHHCHCHCPRWSCCGGCGVSSSVWLLATWAAEGGRLGFGWWLTHCTPRPGSWVGVRAFWGVQSFFGSSWRRGRTSADPPLEPVQMRKHWDLQGRDEGCWLQLNQLFLFITHVQPIMIAHTFPDLPFPLISWLLLSPPSSWCPAEDVRCGREEPPPTDSRPPKPETPSRWCASFLLMTLISFLRALARRDWPMLCFPVLTSSRRTCR